MKFNFEESMTRHEALDFLLENCRYERKTELISVENSIGRYTAGDIFSKVNSPVFRTSSFDGIAVASKDFDGKIPDVSSWKQGVQFVRADTGDDFPDKFDCVIAIEDVIINGEKLISINENALKEIKPGCNTKLPGSSCKKGELLVPANTKITPMLASMLVVGGIRQLEVIKQPKIVYIPTGDELVYRGEPLKRGKTYESNSILVKGMVEEMGAEAFIMPIIRDNRDDLAEAFDEAVLSGDIIIINGGSSRGSEDFNSELVEEKCDMFRHGIKAAPGRPVGIGVLSGKPVINMPGPAIASFIALDWCIRGLIADYYKTKSAARPMIKC